MNHPPADPKGSAGSFFERHHSRTLDTGEFRLLTPSLELRNVQFAYERGSLVVDIASFSLAPGEQALLTGGSGSGKSTLLQLLSGLLSPDSGEILVAGTGISSLHGAARDLFRGRTIGMIFQTFNLLSGFSAEENVLAALMFSAIPAREHQSRVRELFATLGIDRADAPVEERSIGQQQRIAVARAVACSPAIVLADEPTASLDPDNADAAMTLIQDTCRSRGAALLCVSHDPRMALRFNRRVALRNLNAISGRAGT